MSDWNDYDFITNEREEIVRASVERTGWETVRFEVVDEDPDPPET
jgi:hypothetical protein